MRRCYGVVSDAHRVRHPTAPAADCLTLPGAAAAVVLACRANRGLPAVAGAAALGTLYLGVHVLAPAAMGAGDVKLALAWGGHGLLRCRRASRRAGCSTALVTVVLSGQRTVPHGAAMCGHHRGRNPSRPLTRPCVVCGRYADERPTS